MPRSLLHLGQLNFSSGFAFYWLVCELDMYLQQQHIEMPLKAKMDEMYTDHILREKVKVSITKDQKKNFMQTIWDGVSKSTCFSRMNDPLSVTVVKDDTITPEIYETLPRKFTEELEENEPFVMISHSDVSSPHTASVRETSMSARLSYMCRKAWYGMTNRLYHRMESTDSSEIPIKRMKQHNSRKANAIATGRGRGRAKGQLRRSGVSQTRHRKRTKLIQDDYETWQQVCSVQNECTVDDTDGYDVPDAAQFIKETTSPIILNLSDITFTKHKLKTRNKEEAKYSTRVSSTKLNNDDSEMYKIDSCRSRLLSECTDDSEDSFVIFEDCDDESEAHNQQDTTEYVNKVHCLANDSWMSNNQTNCDSKSNMQSPLRERLLSESSIDSEDSFCIVFKSQLDYLNDYMIDDCDEMIIRESQSEDNLTIENELINENQDSIANDDKSRQEINSEKLTTKKKKVLKFYLMNIYINQLNLNYDSYKNYLHVFSYTFLFLICIII